MTKFSLKLPGTEMAFEGSEKFLDTRVLPLLETMKESHNEEVKRDLLALEEDEQKNLAEMDDCIASLSQANAELAEKMKTMNQKSANLLETIATIARTSAGSDELSVAIRAMQEEQQSFNLQYLALQERMQDESRRFLLLSNIMKTKHDTAKNSISNLR